MHAMTTIQSPLRILVTTWLLLAIAWSTASFAADEELPAPEDVFRYVIFDAGDAVEIDVLVDEGAYLNASDLSFESSTAGVMLGSAELPDADGGVYRKNLFVNIPYTVDGEKPDSFRLTISVSGGLDSGHSYSPQTWIETVEFAKLKADSPKLDFSNLGSSGQDEFPPPDEVFFPDVYVVDGNTLEVSFRIIPGYYLYKSRLSVSLLSDSARAGTPGTANRQDAHRRVFR